MQESQQGIQVRGMRLYWAVGGKMSEVMVILKIFPTEPGKETEVEKGLRGIKTGKIAEIKKEPLAFGMYVVKVGIILPNKAEGEMTALEEEVKAIPGVNQVEVETTTLL